MLNFGGDAVLPQLRSHPAAPAISGNPNFETPFPAKCALAGT